MSKPGWEKKGVDEPAYKGVRAADFEEIGFFDEGTQIKIESILDAMVWGQVIVFRYGDCDRVVAPFVVGVSSEGNALMRGYQLEGASRSGKGEGWRVFQIQKMAEVENHWDFFEPDEFVFNDLYPWTYRVFATL